MRAFLWFVLVSTILGIIVRMLKLASDEYPETTTAKEAALVVVCEVAFSFWAFYLLLS